jgi:hypothetical protein
MLCAGCIASIALCWIYCQLDVVLNLMPVGLSCRTAYCRAAICLAVGPPGVHIWLLVACIAVNNGIINYRASVCAPDTLWLPGAWRALQAGVGSLKGAIVEKGPILTWFPGAIVRFMR